MQEAQNVEVVGAVGVEAVGAVGSEVGKAGGAGAGFAEIFTAAYVECESWHCK